MAWNVNAPGLSEAVLDALVLAIQDGIPNLNACLQRDSNTSNIPTITTSNVIKGYIDGIWQPSIQGMVMICVVAGSHPQGVAFQSEPYLMDQSPSGGKKTHIHNSIYVLFHPDLFKIQNFQKQLVAQQTTVTRVMDWLRGGVLNFTQLTYNSSNGLIGAPNSMLPLGSNETSNTPASDTLDMCILENGTIGAFALGYGTSITYQGILCNHSGVVV